MVRGRSVWILAIKLICNECLCEDVPGGDKRLMAYSQRFYITDCLLGDVVVNDYFLVEGSFSRAQSWLKLQASFALQIRRMTTYRLKTV